MEVLLFLLQTWVISFSGVMAPGAVTAATVALGTRSKYAGAKITVGHCIIEAPLIILIMLGMGRIFESDRLQMMIGFAGGMFLLFMGVQMLLRLKRGVEVVEKFSRSSPIFLGIVLSVSNPFFLIWWITVGLTLAINAKQLGAMTLGLFAIVHWLSDLAWLQLLSWASFHGTKLMGDRVQKIVMAVCATALLLFGLKFIISSTGLLTKLMAG